MGDRRSSWDRVVVGGGEYDRLASLYAQRVAAQDTSAPGYGAVWTQLAACVAGPGQLVVPPMACEPHLDALVRWGRVLDGAGAQLVDGEASQCHANSSQLWLSGAAEWILVGYALSTDGLWRQHTAAMDASGTVLETTEARAAYHAARLSPVGAWAFCAGQLGEGELGEVVTTDRLAGLVQVLPAVYRACGDTSRDAVEALGEAAWEPW